MTRLNISIEWVAIEWRSVEWRSIDWRPGKWRSDDQAAFWKRLRKRWIAPRI